MKQFYKEMIRLRKVFGRRVISTHFVKHYHACFVELDESGRQAFLTIIRDFAKVNS